MGGVVLVRVERQRLHSLFSLDMQGGVAFKSKGDKAKREKSLRKSTLSFDAEDEPSERPSPRPSVPASHPPPHAGGDADDDDVDSLAAMRAERQRRKERHSSRSKASLDAPRPLQRPVNSVTVGDDYDTRAELAMEDDGAQGENEGGAGLYSKEGLAALRNNAIHVGARSTSPSSSPAPQPTASPIPLDDVDSALSPHEAARQQRLIRDAKTQRARARALADAGEDFIPLSSSHPLPTHSPDDDDDVAIERVVTRNTIVLDGAPAARVYAAVSDGEEEHGTLMREDDTDDVVDVTGDAREVEGGDRLHFGDDGRQQRKEKRRKEIEDTLMTGERIPASPASHISVDSEEVDSEMEEWEVEQLKKGGVKVRDPRPVDPIVHRPPKADTHRPPPPNASQPAISSLSYTTLHSSLVSHLSSLRQVHASTLSHSASLVSRVADLRASQLALQRKAEETEEAFEFYQEMRTWLQSLLAMLAEKVEDIDEAWEEMTRMRRRRGEVRRERHRLLLQDEWEDAFGKSGSTLDAVPEVDEFGRDVGYVREIDRQRRDDIRRQVDGLLRLQKERRKKEVNAPSKDLDDIHRAAAEVDGWESEEELLDEVDGSAALDSAALSSFHEDVRAVMSDVDVEWRDLDVVAGHFEHWKRRYPKAYEEAFIDLSIPKVFAPYIRLELMQMQLLPSLSTSPSPYDEAFAFSSLPWFHSVQRYVGTLGHEPADEDSPILSSLLSSLFCPLLASIIREEWDVSSERQAIRLQAVVQKLLPPPSASDRAARADLRSALLERLTAEVDETAQRRPPLTVAASGSGEAVRRWCVRQLKLLHVTRMLRYKVDDKDDRVLRRQARSSVVDVIYLLTLMGEQSGEEVEKGLSVIMLMVEVVERLPFGFAFPSRMRWGLANHLGPHKEAAPAISDLCADCTAWLEEVNRTRPLLTAY